MPIPDTQPGACQGHIRHQTARRGVEIVKCSRLAGRRRRHVIERIPGIGPIPAAAILEESVTYTVSSAPAD